MHHMQEEEVWRLLDLEYESAFRNLAVEEAIPTSVGKGTVPNTIRFWRNTNAVVIGCFQSVALEANPEACKLHGTTIVRRFTGGGAVYHDHGNLNYSIALQQNHCLVTNDLSETFRTLSLAVAAGLESLGARVEYESPNTLQINGRKIAGAAGAIRKGFVFFHGSILVDTDLGVLSEVLSPASQFSPKRYVRSVRRDVSNLSIEIARRLTIQEVKYALRRGFEKAFTLKLTDGSLTEEEKLVSDTLLEEKYSQETWNFKR